MLLDPGRINLSMLLRHATPRPSIPRIMIQYGQRDRNRVPQLEVPEYHEIGTRVPQLGEIQHPLGESDGQIPGDYDGRAMEDDPYAADAVDQPMVGESEGELGDGA